MSTKSSARVMATLAFGGALFALLGTQACTLASPTYITTQEGEQTAADAGAGGVSPSSSSASPSGGAGATCGTNDFVKADVSKLTACGNSKGHCFDKTKTPMADQLVACPNANEVCVPDEILAANGNPLTSCKSIIGPGACVTMSLLPAGEKRAAGALKQDTCSAGQVCAPCIDPTNNNAPTPFCQPIGVHEKPCAAAPAGGSTGGAATAAPGCCTTKGKSNGICISESGVPEAQRDKAVQDTCADANKCVPKAMVEGKPVTCDAGILGAGVCMDKCFNKMLSIAGGIGILDGEGCGETELCIPCKLVADQGVPGCAATP